MNTGTILIVDDNKGVLASLELLLENYFSKILTASNPNQITALLTTRRIDVVILDMNFSAGINNGNEGLYWLGHIRQMAPTLPVVMLTAYGDVELAVKALKNGAADFLLKPWNNQTLIDKVTEAYRSRKAPERTAKVDRAEGFEMLVGRSPAMLQLMKVVSKVARHGRQHPDNGRKRNRQRNTGTGDTPPLTSWRTSDAERRYGGHQRVAVRK